METDNPGDKKDLGGLDKPLFEESAGHHDDGIEVQGQPPKKAKPAPAEKPSRASRIAQEIAGGILLVNAVFLIVEMVALPEPGAKAGSEVGGIVGAVIIGAMLLAGNPKGLVWARIAVVLGAVFFTLKSVAEEDVFSAAFQLVFSASLLLLIFGSPGKKRIVASIAMAGLCFLLETLGIVIEVTGNNYLLAAINEVSGDLQPLPGDTLTGTACPYTLKFADDGNWLAMSPAQVRVENPDADAWVMDSIRDAHVMVIVEEADLDADTLADIILESVSESLQGFKIEQRSAVRTEAGLEGVLATAFGSADGVDIGYKYAFFGTGGRAYQIVCFTGSKDYPRVEASFSKIISSFVPAPSLPPMPVGDAGAEAEADAAPRAQ